MTSDEAAAVLDVGPEQWVEAATQLRVGGCDYFDWLSAYDDLDAGLAVVLRVWSVARRQGAMLRTWVSRADGSLPTLTSLWAGAAWHERETAEMFGVEFTGHPDPRPLLLPDGFDGHPLRKDFVLASRVAKEWPGAKEPGESVAGRKRPPGVPGPGTWGP
ncbi:MAG TPA: NADH-quinone oxidoreductase subunit C [Mycobacteriales bacterium]|nr:NADH-quinone oxidoreductase subunit C [Mycobacteriales bacterium]